MTKPTRIALLFCIGSFVLLSAHGAPRRSGAEIYRADCARCHGPTGEGVADKHDEPLYGDRSVKSLARLIARTMPEEAGIWQGVTLPANFTPMMVLGNNVLTRARSIDPELSDLVAAHEFGHTGALVHSEVERNLMFPGVAPGIDDCTDSLDDAQLALMGASYGLGPSAALQLKRPAQIPPARALRPMSSLFAPARIRAMLAGDPQTTRAFVELLFHGRGPAAQ